MKTSTMRRASGCILAAGVIFGSVSVATAQTAPPTTSSGPTVVSMNTGVLLVKQSNDRKVGRETGAGVMMTSLTAMGGNKVLAVWMDSDVKRIDSGWQGKTAVVQLNATTMPSLVGTPTQISSYGGERPFNHPAIAPDATGMYAVVNFASTKDDPNTTRQYAQLLGPDGKNIGTPLKISRNDNQNSGAASIISTGKNTAGESTFVAGYQQNNNDSYATGLTLHIAADGTPSLEQTFDTLFFTPTNIGRPQCVANSDSTATCCTEVGDNRPPEVGIGCAVIDAQGNIKTKKIVVPSKPNNKIYANQVTISPLGGDVAAMGVVISNGAGRNNNRLGNQLSQAFTMDQKTLAILSSSSATQGTAPFDRHSTLLTTLHGSAGETTIAHLGCSTSGSGGAGLQIVHVGTASAISPAIDRVNELLPVSWACDAAKLANAGLRNPTDQGRDFINAIGNVPNPGYLVPGGWMPEASHFTIVAVPMARNALEGGDKSSANNGDGGGGEGGGGGGGGGDGGTPAEVYQTNSLNFSFIPTAWTNKVQVVMNAAVDASQVKSGWASCISNCGNTNDPTNPYSPHNPQNSGYHPFDGYGTNSACSTAPGGEGSGGSFALVGLAIAAVIARRKRS
jgi:MYXO-CTERM domain-containing protein